MHHSPKERVSTAAPRRPQPSSQASSAVTELAADNQSLASASSPPSPPPQHDGALSDKGSCCSSGIGLQDRTDHLSLSVEQVEAIKEMFEVHDFACHERRKGRKVTLMPSRASVTGRTRASPSQPRRVTSVSRAELLDEKQRYGVALKPLKRSPSAELQRLHDTLFSTSKLDTDDGVASADRLERDNNSNNNSADTASGRLLCEQQLVHDELVRLREWRSQRRMLFEEAQEEQATSRAVSGLVTVSPPTSATNGAATGMGSNALAPPPPFPDMVPPTAGVSLHYFANFIVGPFLASFFPPAQGERDGGGLQTSATDGTATWRPSLQGDLAAPPVPRTSLAPHILGDLDALPEIQQLFCMMDTNADQRVSWDEFCQYVLETGQRRLMDRDSNNNNNSAQADPGLAAGSGGSLRYEIGFTRVPTNESVWQAQYPLVHYLFHKEPFTKLLQSHSFPRFITAGPDGLVKLWRTEPRLQDDTNRTAIVHERNLLSLTSPITNVALSTPAMGDAELVAATALDGTVTLLRVATGEVVRTLQGVRTANATEVSVMNEVAKSRRGVDHEARECEAQDLLSLRARQPGVSSTVLRQPYTVDAYHDEAVEIFFGQASRYFRGLEVLAPTYEHLKRPISLTADVLFSFGAQPTATDKWLTANATKANHRPPPRSRSSGADPTATNATTGGEDDRKKSNNWFATSVGLAAVSTGGGTRRIPSGDYLLLGFENGVLQAYELNQTWFHLSNLSAARVEPPSGRRPAFTTQAHSGPITHMVVSEAADMLFTAGADGMIEVRSLARLEASMLRLGDGVHVVGTMGLTASPSTPLMTADAESAGHTKRVTCMAFNDAQRVLVTGGMDYRVFFWSSRSPRPLFRVDLREQQRNVAGLNSLGASGYPVDVSFMQHGTEPVRVIVLDSKRVIRFLNALNGQLMGFLVDHSPESIALGDMLVARYEAANDRLLLGGRCLRVWNTVKEGEYAEDYYGHRKPVLFMQWHEGLQAMVTADEERVVMWRITFGLNESALARRERRRAAHAACCDELIEKAERLRLLTRLDNGRPGTAPAATATAQQGRRLGRGSDDPLSPDAGAVGGGEEANDNGAVRPDHRAGGEDTAGLPVLFDDVYDGVCPTQCLTDRCPNNHTYTVAQTRLLRTFNVEEGVRNIAMDPRSLIAALFVALLRDNAIVQINVFNGAPLRRFAFAPRAHDIFGLFCGEARMTASEPRPSPLLCAAYEEAADMGITSLYHVRAEDELRRAAGVGTTSDNSSSGSGAAGTRGDKATRDRHKSQTDSDSVVPYRHILSRGSLVTSVLVLSTMNLVVMGGRGQLFMTPVADATAFAIPLRTLVDQASIEETELRRSMMLASQHRQLGLPATAIAPTASSTTQAQAGASTTTANSAATTTVNPRTSTAVLTLTALFPGRLVSDPAVEEVRMKQLYRNAEEQRRRTRLSLGGGGGGGGLTRASSVASETGADPSATPQRRKSQQTATSVSVAFDASFSSPHQSRNDDDNDNKASDAEAEDEDGGEDRLDALLEKELMRETQQQRGASGYIGQLCALGSTGYVLSGSHEGVLQLWHVRTSSEVLRFRVTLAGCNVTALATNVPDHRTTLATMLDPVLVAVGDEAGYVVVLDLSELPWGAAQPLDMLPNLERRVLVVDRWRAHTHDVRTVAFLPPAVANGATVGSPNGDAPPRCPRTATLDALVAAHTAPTRTPHDSPLYERGEEETNSESSLCFAADSLSSTAPSLPACLMRPIVVATAGEDTYTYVWRWQSGLLNCLGCFGMGPRTLVAPPLAEPSSRVPRPYEAARRLYVLRRLVQDRGLFRGFAAAASAAHAAAAPPSLAAAATPSSPFLTPTRPPNSNNAGTPSVGSDRATASGGTSPRGLSPGLSSGSAQSGRHGAAAAAAAAAVASASLGPTVSEGELDEALRFMEDEVRAMLTRDPAAVLSTWGSLCDDKARKAAEDAARNRTRLEVLAAAAAAASSSTAHASQPASPNAAVPGSPFSTPSSLSASPAVALPPLSPPTLFDAAGLDGAFGWMDVLAGGGSGNSCGTNGATAAVPGSSGKMGTLPSYAAPPLQVTLPWLRTPDTCHEDCDGDHPDSRRDPFTATRPAGFDAPTTFCAFSPGGVGGVRRRGLLLSQIQPTDYSGFVVAFMRGAYADEDARACLRRTVLAMRTAIVKWFKRQTHTAPYGLDSGRGSLFTPAESRAPPATSGAVPVHRASSVEVTTVSAVPPPPPAPLLDQPPQQGEASTASATPPHPRPGVEVPSAMSPTRVFFRRASQKTASTSSGSPTGGTTAPASLPVPLPRQPRPSPPPAEAPNAEEEVGQHVGRFRIRGPRGEPVYRVGYSAATPVVRSVDSEPATTALSGETTAASHAAAVVRLSEGPNAAKNTGNNRPAPPLLTAHYRRIAAAAATDDLATRARDPLDGRGVRLVGGGGGGDVLEDEEALASEDAAFVIHNAYLHRRREEALSQLLEVQEHQAQHQDAAQRKRSVKAAAEAGQVGLATFDDFAASGTTTALFGREHLLFDAPAAYKPALASHLREGLPLHHHSATAGASPNPEDDTDVDWYTKRERMRRQRQQEDALWNPSRIMLTLMDWEATLTPNERRAQVNRATSPPSRQPSQPPETTATSSTAAPLRSATVPLTLPGFLPTTMQQSAAIPDDTTDANVDMTVEGQSSTPGDSEVPTKTFSGAMRDMQQSMAQTRNLNAVVALEVQHLRQLMRDSLEEREAVARDNFGFLASPLEGGAQDLPSSPSPSPTRRRRGHGQERGPFAIAEGSTGTPFGSPPPPQQQQQQQRLSTRTSVTVASSATTKVTSLNDSRKRPSVVADLGHYDGSARRRSSRMTK